MEGLNPKIVSRRRSYLGDSMSQNKDMANLYSEFIEWLMERPDTSPVPMINDGLKFWSRNSSIIYYENSPLRRIAEFIFAAPAIASDLE